MKRCPFCNGDNLGVTMLAKHAVQCRGCHATGPWRDSPNDAIASWEQRAPDRVVTGHLRQRRAPRHGVRL